MLKILVAWLLAAIISSPITILATIDTVNIQPEPGICAINNRLFFTLGSIVSFFLPMLIMVNTYILTIRLLKRKAKLCQKENASLQHQNNGSKPCVQCKVLVQDNSKRNNSKSSISSDYSTGLGTTTVKDLGYVIQSKRSKTDDNLKTTNNLSTTVHKDQLTEQTNKQMLAKRNLLSHSTNFSLFERWTRHCSTRHSKTRFKITNDKKSSSPPIELSQTTNGNGSAYNTYEKNNNFETNNGNKNGKTFKKSAKKAQRIRDYESGSRFQGIRVLFSKNKKGNKKSKKSKRKQEIEVQLNEQVDDEKSDEHDKRNENDFDHKSQIYKTNKIDNSTNCDIKQAKKDQQIMLQDQHKIRKSNTFSNLETVNNQKINTTEINNNHQIDEQEKRKQTFDKTNLRINNPSSLALLSPSTISHRTCRLSAHSDIKEISSGTKTTPVTPTTSSNPINSIQPVLVRTLGSSQVLTEQKATKVLGVVFFSFVFCWAPFFSHNFLAGVSPDLVKEVPKSVVSLLQWLGYLSSTLNPIIYTVFNAHFRRTFRKIILCQKLGERNKLKNSSPRLTASRMVSFRNSSFSRNQSSIIRKKTNPSSLNSNRSADLSTPVTNQKPSSFSYSTRSHRKERLESTNKQINELNLVKVVKTTENDLMLNIVHDSASQKQDTQCSSSTVLNELEKPGLK